MPLHPAPQPLHRFAWLWATALCLVTITVQAWMVNRMRGEQSLYTVLSSWDAANYMAIARHGYGTQDTHYAFFPGLPALMRLLHEITGMNYLGSGVVIASLSSIAMAAGMMAIAAQLGAGLRGQLGAAVLMLGAPMSITFTMPYTEAPFLALAAWSLVFMLRGSFLPAAGLVFLSGFFRLTALDLWLTLLIVISLYARRDWRAWLAGLGSAAPLAGYLLSASWKLRDQGGYFGLQAAGWNSKFDFGRATWRWVSEQSRSGTDFGYLVSVFAIVGTVALIVASIGKMPWALWLFGTGVAANVLLSDGIMHARPRLLLPCLVLALPAVLGMTRASIRTGVIAASLWILLGAYLSAYLLIIFEWAI